MKPADRPIFFDVNISFRLCSMIRALEEGRHVVEHGTTHPALRLGNKPFGNNTPDVAWINILAAEAAGWVALSGDIRIVDTPVERRALDAAGLLFFAFDKYFTIAGLYGQALQLVEMWPQVVQAMDDHRSGIFVVRTKRRAIEIVPEGRNSKGGRM